MSKILKNNTASIVAIGDTGQSVPASGQLTIQPADYLLYAASSDTVTLVGDSTLTVNDGSSDLSISDGIDLIKGIFPNPVGINGSDGTQIGNVSDSLKTHITNTINTEFPSGTLDAAGKLRTSLDTVILDVNFQFDKLPLIFTEQTSGGATITYNSNKASTLLNVGTASGDKAIFQTRRHLRYVPGKSQKFILTGTIGGLKTNCVRRAGQFDENNGVFIQIDDDVHFVIRSNTSGTVQETVISRADWNIDKFDGTGPSGVTAAFGDQQLLFIDYLWLGSGVIRFGTLIAGRVFYAHIFVPDGTDQAPWCRTPNNPIRVEIENVATTASATTLQFTCASVASEGLLSPNGALQTVSSGTTPKSFGSSGTTLPVISLRKKAAFYKMPITIEDLGFFAQTNDDFLIEIIKNGTLTGASWQDAPSGRSQFDTSASSISGGEVIYSTYLRSQSIEIISEVFSRSDNAELGSFVDNTSETLSIVATNLSASASISGKINFKEGV